MADEEDETFPPETQKLPTEFAFREFGRLPLISGQINQNSQTRNSLLAVANSYGLFCVGYSAGFKIYTDASLFSGAASEQCPEALVDVPLKSPPCWVAISADNLTLVVCSSGEKGLQALFFDTRNLINKAKPTKTPFCIFPLSKSPQETVVSLHWNPSLENNQYLAICLSSGSFHMLAVTDDIQEIGQKPSDFGACSACWSPRGKQVMVGRKDGSMQQFTPALEIRRTIPVYDAIEGPVKVDDILWLSTLQVAFSYTPITEDEGWQPSLFVVSLPPAKEPNKSPSWRNYEDPCYGMAGPRPSHFMMSFVDKWNLFVIASADASETAVIAKNKNKDMWEIWNLDDSCRAQLPMDENNEELYPLGVAVLYTAQNRIVVDDTRECDAMPVYAMLSCDGHVSLFHMINLQSQDDYPGLVIKAQVLAADGERAPVMNKMGSIDINRTLTDSGKTKLTGGRSMVGDPEGNEAPSSVLSTTQLSTTPLHGDGVFGADKSGTNKLAPRSLSFPNQSTPLVPNPPRSLNVEADPVFKPPPPLDSKPIMKKPLGKTFSVAPMGGGSSALPFSGATPTGTVIAKQEANPISNLKQQPNPMSNQKQQPNPISNQKQQPNPMSNQKQQPNPISNQKQQPNPISNQKQQPDFTSNLRQPADSIPNLDSSFSSLSTAHPQVNSARSSEPSVPSHKRRSSLTRQAVKPPERNLSQGGSSMMDGLASEVGDFEAELEAFITESSGMGEVVASLGGSSEKDALRKTVDALSGFSREIIKTTSEQHDEIKAVRRTALECYAAVQNVGTHRKRVENPAYHSALLARPLDISDQRMMKEVRSLYLYIKDSMKEVNMILDEQWSQSLKQRKQSSLIHKSKRRAEIEEKETIRQAIVNQTQILHNQEMKILLLGQELDKLRLLNSTWQTPFMDSSLLDKPAKFDAPKDNSDLPTLASLLILRKKDESTTAGARPLQADRISPKKAQQLSEFLASRKVASIRSSFGRRSKFIAPSFIKTRHASDTSKEESRSRFSSTTKSEYSAESECSSSESDQPPELTRKPGTSGYYFTNVDDSTIVDEKTSTGLQPSDVISKPQVNLPSVVQSASRPASEPAPESPPPASIEGTSTFTYGGPESSRHIKPSKKFDPSASQAEAASNLNNPPKVVNIKELSNPQVVNPLQAPLTFQAKSSIPAAVANEVQKVLNTVHAGQSQSSVDGSSFTPNSKVDNAVSTLKPSFRSTSFSFSTGGGSGAPSSSFAMKLPSAPNSVSADHFMQRSASDRSLFPARGLIPKSSSLASLLQRPSIGTQDTRDAPPEGVLSGASVPPLQSKEGAPASQPRASLAQVERKNYSTGSTSALCGVGSKPEDNPTTASTVLLRGSLPNLSAHQADPTGAGSSSTNTSVSATTGFLVSSSVSGSAIVPANTAASGSLSTSSTAATATSGLSFEALARTTLRTSSFNAVPSTGSTGSLFGAPTTVSSSGSISTEPVGNTSSGSLLFGLLAATTSSGNLPVGVQPATTTSSSSLFGAPAASASTGSSLFNAPAVTTSSSSSLFSAPATIASSASSLFSTPSATTSSGSSLFDKPVDTTSSGNSLISAPAATTSSDSSLITAPAATTNSESSLYGAPATIASSGSSLFVTTTSSTSLFGVPVATTTSGTSVFGVPAVTTASGTSVFGAPAATTTSGTSVFGVPPATTTSVTSVFGTPAAITTSGTSVFGTPAATTTSGTSVFGTPAATITSGASVFGAPVATTTSGTSVFGAPAATTTSGTSVFGAPAATTTSGTSVFGAPAATTTSGTSVFGAPAATTTSGTSVFGTPAGTTSSGSSLFGVPTATTTTGLSFGAGPFGKPGFGSPSTFGAPSGSGFGSSKPFGGSDGGGFLSGLGSTPSQSASGNPFASNQPTASSAESKSLFGNAATSPFAAGFGQTSSAGTGFGSAASSSGTGFGSASSEATKAFGSFVKPASGGFGAPAVFGSPPSFGSKPVFGTTPQFGTSSFGSQPSGFGSPAAFGAQGASSSAGFGSSGFGAFAKSDTPGFGALAQQGNSPGGFGALSQQTGATSGFGALSNQPASGFGGGFGSASTAKPSFTGWR